jgi:hypothetical protein
LNCVKKALQLLVIARIGIDQYIGPERNDPVSAAAGACMGGVAAASAVSAEIQFQEVIHFGSEIKVGSDSTVESVLFNGGQSFQVGYRQFQRFQLFTLI